VEPLLAGGSWISPNMWEPPKEVFLVET
jgi:hypothetical protein